MPYIYADADIEDFDTRDLCDEIIRRLAGSKRKQLTKEQKRDLKEVVEDLSEALGFSTTALPNNTLEDRLKIEYISSIWDKLTPWQLEDKLKVL